VSLPAIRVYNTLTRRKEVFESLEPGFVRMYVCGPTVYDYSHVGHARTYVAFDAVKRYLSLRGYDVVHVQNITDIDDKIINRSISEGKDWREIAEEYTRDYLEALEKLNIHVHIHPRVTEHIGEIIEFIQDLVDKGYAYVSNGSVYFEVDKYPDYGRLSGRFSKEQWRQEEEVLRDKRKPYDFALWKKAKPGEPWWESPWGPGRPGWHIECSVLSSRYLGERFDIHGGGRDLVFPHHENERAQSEARLGGGPWVKYWMHTGMLTVRGDKMSKSLGNIVLLRELFKKWRPQVVRLWLLGAHYRSQVDFSEEALGQAQRLYEKLRTAAWTLRSLLAEAEPSHRLGENDLRVLRGIHYAWIGFHEEMSNDFNTPGALRHVNRLLSLINSTIVNHPAQALVLRAYSVLEEFNRVLGVLDDVFQPALREDRLEALIRLIVEVRQKHRAARDYETADWIRSELAKLGVRLMDSKDKTTWIIE